MTRPFRIPAQRSAIAFILALSSSVPAFSQTVPPEFVGTWGAKGQCQSGNVIVVETQSVSLVNATSRKNYAPLDICYSCAGGARYSGLEVWVMKNSPQTPFALRFNADEKKGALYLEATTTSTSFEKSFVSTTYKKCKR